MANGLKGKLAILLNTSEQGLDFGQDHVTPVETVIGVVVSESKDHKAIRVIEDVNGKRWKASAYTYLLPSHLYPCALLMVLWRTRGDRLVQSVGVTKEWLRDVIHDPDYRSGVLYHDLAPASTTKCLCYERGWRRAQQ